MASFVCTVSDGNGGFDDSTTFVSVEHTFAVDDSFETEPGQPLVVSSPGVLANDQPGPGDILSLIGCTVPDFGLLSFDPMGGIAYIPPAGFVGFDTFTCTVSNGNGGSDTSTTTVSVMNTFAEDDNFSTPPGQPLVVGNPGILGNDDVTPGTSLNVDDCTTPTSGILSFDQSGGFIFLPATAFVGDVTFTCTISDGSGGLSMSTITIAVTFFAPSTPSSPTQPTNQVPSISPRPTISAAPFEDGIGGLPGSTGGFFSQLSELSSSFFSSVLALVFSTMNGETTVVSGASQLLSLVFTFIFGSLIGTIGSVGFWGIWDWLMYNYISYYCYW